MRPYILLSCALAAFGLTSTARAGRLNDTGQVRCYDAGAATGTVSVGTPNASITDGTFARQDCTRGLAAADAMGQMTKTGASSVKGRDYTKVANNGGALPASAALGAGATDWACTQDNLSGLVWEIKTSDGGTRDINKRYAWSAAVAYVATVNALALCGSADWRLPTLKELTALVDYGASAAPVIDGTYFPNTTASPFYWTGTESAATASNAWYVSFNSGLTTEVAKTNAYAVRLVRGGP